MSTPPPDFALPYPTVTIDDITTAARRIDGHVVTTPCTYSQTLSAITGAHVFVKFENLQFTASYKERGALNRLLCLPENTVGVVAASAGNFAQGVAHHATRLGIDVTIVMPIGTPSVKVTNTQYLGGTVVLGGDTFDAASAHARELAVSEHRELLSPFNDELVIAGQGTVALEILAVVHDLDVIIVPAGGGGLLAGIAVATRAVAPGVEIVGVQTEQFPGIANAFNGSALRGGGPTIAEGIAVAVPGDRTVALIAGSVDRVVTVPEHQIERAIAMLVEIEKTVAEGAGAVALAELLTHPETYVGKRVAIVISGGNIEPRQLASVLLRSLVRNGRIATLWVELPDRPGMLARLATVVGDSGANIVEVQHQRLDLGIHARSTEVQLTIETAGVDHTNSVIEALAHAGFVVRVRDAHTS